MTPSSSDGRMNHCLMRSLPSGVRVTLTIPVQFANEQGSVTSGAKSERTEEREALLGARRAGRSVRLILEDLKRAV